MNLRLKKLSFVMREIVALGLWLFIVTKVFVYDIDLLLVRRVGWLQRIYPYKFFFIIAVVAAIWLILGGKYARKIILFVAAYPLILLWRIVKILFKNWATLLLFAPALESVILTFKWRFILGSFAMLAALGISQFSRPIAITMSMSVLGLYLIVHYAFRFRGAYRPESIFANIAPTIGLMWEQSINTFKNTESAERNKGAVESPELRKKHIQNLKNLYLNNLLFTYVATKLRQSVSSRRTDLYFIVALIYTFILTVVVFGFEYWALFKISSSSFRASGEVSSWAFFLFSFNAMLHTGFATVVANSAGALVLANLELVAGLIIGLLFVFILLTSQRERYRQDLSTVVDQLSRSAGEIESFLDKELGMKLIEVEVKIIEEEPGFSAMMQSFGRTPPPTAPAQQNEQEQKVPSVSE